MRRFGIWRLGADAQAYFDIPYVGGTALKGEVVFSQDDEPGFPWRRRPIPAATSKGFGWILTVNQNIGDYFGIAARFDQWNPNRDVNRDDAVDVVHGHERQGQRDNISTLGIGPLLYISANLKLSAIYEHVWRVAAVYGLGSPSIAPANSIASDYFTLQLQARF